MFLCLDESLLNTVVLVKFVLEPFCLWTPEVNMDGRCALCNKIGKEKEKTTPFGINSMRSQVLYQAAQEQQNNML
jgi:hypothetical protein